MPRPNSVAGEYPIEASGWDADGAFFVERSELIWGEDGNKSIQLHCKMQSGAFVFVRLLDATGDAVRFPIPHQVDGVAPLDRGGSWAVRLVQSQPRAQFLSHLASVPSI